MADHDKMAELREKHAEKIEALKTAHAERIEKIKEAFEERTEKIHQGVVEKIEKIEKQASAEVEKKINKFKEQASAELEKKLAAAGDESPGAVEGSKGKKKAIEAARMNVNAMNSGKYLLWNPTAAQLFKDVVANFESALKA